MYPGCVPIYPEMCPNLPRDKILNIMVLQINVFMDTFELCSFTLYSYEYLSLRVSANMKMDNVNFLGESMQICQFLP